MSNGYVGGSVKAEITLDTTKFDEAIKNVKETMKTLKQNFKDISLASVAKDVQNLKKQVDELKKVQDKLTNGFKKTENGVREFNQSVVQADKSTRLFRKNFDMIMRSTYLGKDIAKPFLDMQRESTKANISLNETVKGVKTASNATVQFKNELVRLSKAIKSINKPSNFFANEKLGYKQLEAELTKYLTKLEIVAAMNKQNKGTRYDVSYSRRLGGYYDAYSINNLKNATAALQTFDRLLRQTSLDWEKLLFGTKQGTAVGVEKQFVAATEGAERYRQKINQLSAELQKYYLANEKYYASVGAMSHKYWTQIRNSTISNPTNRNGEPFAQSTFKAQTVTLQDYYKNIERVNKALVELAQKQKIATGQLGTAWKSNGIGLNQYYQNLSKINRELDKQAQKVQRVKNAQLQLQYYQRTDWLNQYKGNMKEINAQLEKQTANTRNAGRGLTSFNNGVVQTAHSGRILSNTLYQIRGALLSLKMIFTAMGGMALWGFATQIAEGVKETFKAKNEMEAQLKQNSKVDAGGIQYFNNQLDELTKNFKKINKYSIGETVSSIGLEFNLNAKQMADSLDIVSMIQSEYVRAGRKESEAALAVKDILQGEFQRLSRETGVGKEELVAYGWDEDKTNIEGLMKALRKAALDRHWDVFAKKATSLNDVMTIMKSRFSETGADVLQSVTPMIVEGFNMMINAIDGFQRAFKGLNPLWQNVALMGGGTALFTGILTALPMVTKGMGLADIATIGWGKSIATAALNLNKAEVAQYGFRKALAATITGQKASELANVRTTKAIMGRLLGVKQSVLAEHGYMTALVQSRGVLRNHTGATNIAKISSMGFAQKLAYLTNNMKLQDAQSLKTSTAIRKFATSWTVLGTAIKGVMAIGIIAWLATLASQAAETKKQIEAFNEISATGGEKLESARKDLQSYTEQMEKYQKGTIEYDRAAANKKIVEGNVKDLETANKLVGSYKLQNKEREKSIKLASQIFRKNNLVAAGLNERDATEKAGGWADQVSDAQEKIVNSYQQQYNWLKSSSKHITEHVNQLKDAGASEKQRLDYVKEYSLVAEEAGEHLKQFYQGNINALAYFAWDRVRLAWIDIANHPEVVKLFNNLGATWKSWQPTLKAIAGFLQDIGLRLVDLANWVLSSDSGRIVTFWGAVAAGVGLTAYRFRGVFGRIKDVIGGFKTLGGKLKDIIGKWKTLGDKAEEANEKMGGKSKDKTSTSTGGITDKTPTSRDELKNLMKGDFYNNVRSFADNATKLASAMFLVTEAILLLNAPMGALAVTGVVFKNLEPHIRNGIEGLKLIAPTIAIFLPPVVALMLITNKFGAAFSVKESFVTSAEVIAAGLLLVGEAVLMMVAPMGAIAALGFVKGVLGDSVEKGKEAIQETVDALTSLYPIIPVFAAALVMGVISVATEGVGLVVQAAAIAAGMLLVAEAIVTLGIPMKAIAELGSTTWIDFEGVKQGSERIKVAAEALTYVEEATRVMALVKWEVLGGNIADIISQLTGHNIGEDLVKLTEENGFLDQMEKFAKGFNAKSFTPIEADKAAAFKSVADSLGALNEALESAKNALANLPAEFKNGGDGKPLIGYDMATNSMSVEGNVSANGVSADTSGYFDQLKQPIEDLAKFMNWFNNITIPEPNPDNVTNLTASASMVEQINNAVTQVKNTMGTIGMGNLTTAFAQITGGTSIPAFGGVGAVGSMISSLMGGGGTGDYKSSIGSQLYEMEMVLTDLSTFNSNISSLGGDGTSNGGTGGSGNAQALTGMVTAVSDAITKLQNTLAQAVPQIKANAKNIGVGIKTGIKEGMNNLGSDLLPQLTSAFTILKAYAGTYGKGVGYQGKEGFKSEFKIKDAVSAELQYALTEMDNKKPEFYQKGYALGKASADGFKDGDDSHSPGIIARTMFDEMMYVGQSLDDAINTIPQKSYALGNALATSFTPQFATDFGLTNMSAFETGLQGISNAATTTDLQTTSAFNDMNLTANTSMMGMTNSVNGAFNNIQQNTTTKYSQLVNTTRVSLNTMQSQTTRNIMAIRTSWKGMQNALIQSAENIRSETGAKIKSLENNMASFWSKVQNPSTLMASAAGPINGSGTIRRRNTPTSIRRTSSRKGTSKRTYAAGPFQTGKKYTGITTSFNNSGKSYGMKVRNLLAEYLQCLSNGGNCAMGSGWSFNWTKDIQDALMTWHTHFGEIYDDKLRVGSFENDDFPVRGDADIFKKYVYDAISRTQYQGYFDSKCGNDPIAAYNSGHFNCWDGSNIVMRLASAFGFSSHRVWGSWDGIPHVWAHVDGVGDIDATAIQGGHGLFASKVRAAGPLKVRNSSKGNATGLGDTHNYGDVNVTINVYGDDVEVNENKVDKSTARQIIDLLGVNPATGQ